MGLDHLAGDCPSRVRPLNDATIDRARFRYGQSQRPRHLEPRRGPRPSLRGAEDHRRRPPSWLGDGRCRALNDETPPTTLSEFGRTRCDRTVRRKETDFGQPAHTATANRPAVSIPCLSVVPPTQLSGYLLNADRRNRPEGGTWTAYPGRHLPRRGARARLSAMTSTRRRPRRVSVMPKGASVLLRRSVQASPRPGRCRTTDASRSLRALVVIC